MGERIRVEIAWPAADTVEVRSLALDMGATVADALAALERLHPGTLENPDGHTVGVFGRVVTAGQVLEEGDRVEIYAQLPNDPKIARRERARQAGRRR